LRLAYPAAIEFHLSNIYAKIGVTSRTEAILKISESRCRAGQPFYLRVRSYQAWLESVFEDVGAETSPRQCWLSGWQLPSGKLSRQR
jgi:hypothetical protein